MTWSLVSLPRSHMLERGADVLARRSSYKVLANPSQWVRVTQLQASAAIKRAVSITIA
jgi:hypothetical protein